MVLLASDYDKSRFLKADGLDGDRKLRIKSVTEELVGAGAEKEKKLVVWFTNDERGLVLNRREQSHPARCVRRRHSGLGRQSHHHLPDDGGDARQDGAGTAGANPAAQTRRPSGGCHQAEALRQRPDCVAAKPKPPVDEELDDIDAPPAQSQTTDADEFDDEIPF